MRVDGACDVGADQLVVGLAEERACRRVAGTLQEHRLAVDQERRSLAPHVAKRDAFREPVARNAVDLHVELQAAQQLRTERTRPPARWVVDGQGPRELVRTGREGHCPPRVEQHLTGRPAYDGVQASLTRLGGRVERYVAREAAALGGGVDAEHAGAIDAHRPRRREPDRPPDPARVQRAVEHRRLPVAARDRSLRAPVALRRARDLDREHVVVALAQPFGDLERVPREITLGRPEVLAVEPRVAVVEDAVELEEPTAPVVRSGDFGRIGHRVGEAPAVEQRSVVVGERALRAPVVRDGNARPRAVVAFGFRKGFRKIRFGNVRAPFTGQAHHLGSARLTAHRAPAYARRMSRPATLGDLRASGWESRPVKEEIRANAVKALAEKRPLVEGVVGYDDTVLPQLANALLAGHDMIFLGERGQAKTRMIRELVGLLDEWMPIVAGSEINDDPYAPASTHARHLVADRGDDTPIEWVHRDRRYGEKLATPDTSIADLIGEVDPIKVAEGRYLSDELTIHYGLVPRTNRGIFAINELPDLAERIQVGLLNVLEERDVQIRGYKIRLPLDVMLVATANPEDYTNRGRIITPLKDRFGSQIRTHYPLETELEMAIIDQEARPLAAAGLQVSVPDFMTEIVAEISQLARRSPHVNQRSGVSARLSISNYETLVANAARRALASGEREVVPRVSDLAALAASSSGKIEIETLDDGREGQVLERILKAATLEVFRARVRPERLGPIVASFEDGSIVHTGEDVPATEYRDLISKLEGMPAVLADLGVGESPAGIASGIEFVLEGLHLTKRLNKDAVGTRASYRGRG